ncbi:MAG TPA: hypothetical protein VEZ48_12235 [Sphingomonadaceae bacterium]|nr:hypothetical protein [Sphingomonadaceae bacterium]
MQRPPSRALLLAAVAAGTALAFPAASQDAPQSILPPGFGEAPAPAPPPPAPRVETPEGPDASTASEAPRAPRRSSPPRAPLTVTLGEGDEIGEGEELVLVPPPPPIEMPEDARRSPALVGTIDASGGGFPPSAFGTSHGKYLQTLMRRTDAPLPSRWAQIALRRALLSRIPAPQGVHPADWVAERAWLLLRMGEADGARLLVQGVDVADFTPKMYDVAVQAALATADPAGLCPLEEGGRRAGNPRIWTAVSAMCAALSGEGGRAGSEIAQARRQRGGPRGIDLLLVEKVAGAGVGTRRAVTIQWDGVERLNAWRFGLANATGILIPPALFPTAGMQVRAWQARAPLIALTDRLPYAMTAAAMGVFSNASLVQIYSLLGDDLDVSEFRDSDPGRLQSAYVGTGPARIAALRSLWNKNGADAAYANQILTAGAAARLLPASIYAGDVDNIVSSLFAAGMVRPAARWSALVEGLDDSEADRAWAMLAVGAPARTVDASAGRVEGFVGRDASPDKLRSRLLVAALAGLGRLDPADTASLTETLNLPLGAANPWTRALEKAAAGGEAGTSVLLAGVGLQAPDWRRVPPHHLYRIMRALRASGEDYAARMIAAEALSRT